MAGERIYDQWHNGNRQAALDILLEIDDHSVTSYLSMYLWRMAPDDWPVFQRMLYDRSAKSPGRV